MSPRTRRNTGREAEQLEQHYKATLGAEESDVTESDMIDAVDDMHEDPLSAVRAIALLRRWLDDREDDAVLKCRIEGASWQQIADAAGRTRQAVRKVHADPNDEG